MVIVLQRSALPSGRAGDPPDDVLPTLLQLVAVGLCPESLLDVGEEKAGFKEQSES